MNWSWRSDGGRLALLLLLAFLYLSPGGMLWLEGRTDQVLSDGTDPAPVPYAYSIILDHLHNRPSSLFYGAIPTDRLNPPEGFALWLPWTEKWAVAFFGLFTPLEQLTTAYIWLILSLSAASFYWMARVLGWNRALGFALAICWAFNAYTLARIKVHGALAGVYHLPLIVVGIHLSLSGKTWRTWMAATLAFLLAAGTAHYYMIITAFLAPLFLLYIWLLPDWRSQPRRAFAQLGLAVLPALILIGHSYLNPLPKSEIKAGTITHIQTGQTSTGEMHPFMYRFAAQPIDFFTGTIAIGSADINPLRTLFNENVRANLGEGNLHERSNGIRWMLWLALVMAFWVLIKHSDHLPWTVADRRRIWFYFGLFGFCFCLALPPDFWGWPIGPSAWLYGLIPQFRVPSRAGIFAQFAALLVVGEFLHSWLFAAPTKGGTKKVILWPRWRRRLLWAGALPLLAVAELPPFLNSMPVARVVPARADLADGQPCGYGLYFPYASGTWALLEYYYFLQSMRGSQCKIVNAMAETTSVRNRLLMQAMPIHEKFFAHLEGAPAEFRARLVQFARCVPLDWLVFDPRVSEGFATQVCADLGWSKTAKDTCRSPEKDRPLRLVPEMCWQ